MKAFLQTYCYFFCFKQYRFTWVFDGSYDLMFACMAEKVNLFMAIFFKTKTKIHIQNSSSKDQLKYLITVISLQWKIIRERPRNNLHFWKSVPKCVPTRKNFTGKDYPYKNIRTRTAPKESVPPYPYHVPNQQYPYRTETIRTALSVPRTVPKKSVPQKKSGGTDNHEYFPRTLTIVLQFLP